MTKTLVFTPSIPSGRQGPTEFCRGRKDVVLHWNNVAQYEAIQIERNGALLGEIPGGLSEYRDSSVPEGVYTYKVIATSGGQKSFPMSTLLSTFSPIGTFLRGDANRDGVVDVSDPVATLSFLFLGGKALPCEDAADANDDGELNLSDAITTLSFLFLGKGVLRAPGSSYPWFDPTPDELGCRG